MSADETVDISLVQKNLDGSLKKLHAASGMQCGGTCVDKNYIEWLTQIFGKVVIERFKREYMEDYVDMLREFENKKRSIAPDTQGLITLRVSAALTRYHKESGEEQIVSKIERLSLKDVQFHSNKLRVPVDLVRKWFQHPIDMTIRYITEILAKPDMKDVNTILFVGGFAESKLVQDAMRQALRRWTVIIPNEPGMSVLKGAVTFGYQAHLGLVSTMNIISTEFCETKVGVTKKATIVSGYQPHRSQMSSPKPELPLKNNVRDKIVEHAQNATSGVGLQSRRSQMSSSKFDLHTKAKVSDKIVELPQNATLEVGHQPRRSQSSSKTADLRPADQVGGKIAGGTQQATAGIGNQPHSSQISTTNASIPHTDEVGGKVEGCR